MSDTAEAPKRTKKTRPPSEFLLANYYSIPQLAEVLGRTIRWVYRAMSEGTAPPITRIGNRTLFRKKSVEAWLSSLEEKPEQPRRRA